MDSFMHSPGPLSADELFDFKSIGSHPIKLVGMIEGENKTRKTRKKGTGYFIRANFHHEVIWLRFCPCFTVYFCLNKVACPLLCAQLLFMSAGAVFFWWCNRADSFSGVMNSIRSGRRVGIGDSRRLHESPTSWALLLINAIFHGLAPVANMTTTPALEAGTDPVGHQLYWTRAIF